MDRAQQADEDPKCTMCGRGYDPEFMTSLPCRVFSPDDVPNPGCPPQQEDMRQTSERVRRSDTAPTGGGCLFVLLTLLFCCTALMR